MAFTTSFRKKHTPFGLWTSDFGLGFRSLLVTTVLLFPPLLHAQEMSPQLKKDISTFQGRIIAEQVLQLQEHLGSSFNTEDFIRQLEEALKKPVLTEPKNLCEMSVYTLRKTWERRDVDDAELLRSLRRFLRELPEMDDELRRNSYERSARKLMQQTTPILQAREAAKEQRVLELNARREGVVLLPNGVQMEVKPGKDSIRRVNRITREEGISRTERITTECSVDDLPPAVSRMMEHIPAGSAWTFWIPSEVADAVAHSDRDSADAGSRREALLALLADDTRYQSYDAGQAEIDRLNNADNAMPEPRTPMVKLTVWHEDEDAPIRPFGEEE